MHRLTTLNNALYFQIANIYFTIENLFSPLSKKSPSLISPPLECLK